MDYTSLLQELKEASIFDLYRLYTAISKELNNPAHIAAIKKRLKIGMDLSYFDNAENRTKQVSLLALKAKKVVVLDKESYREILLPYCMLNIDGINTEINEQKNTDVLTANNLKVGDRVGFNNNGENIVGIIKRLNHKTVTMIIKSGEQWRVGYSHLHRIHDAEVGPDIEEAVLISGDNYE
ncbi:MAG: hypothetical protein COB50_05600 [Thiotrichales bacterium]|nr:MAG: hypothetical protein COB50_05600 [Thiotrichales bacterium]